MGCGSAESRRVLPQIGQVAAVPSSLGSMNVAQPLVEQNSRRAAAERRSLRCAADLWLKPEGVKERDNIRVSLSGEPPAGLVRASLCDEVPLDDGIGRSGSLLGICANRASVFIMLAAWIALRVSDRSLLP
jgi:hypothetical protein